jgi:hypothetical protein
MNLKLIQTKTGTWKLITNSNNKNPALVRLAELLRGANKSNGLHIGIYSVTGGFLTSHIKIYSYISEKSERMSKTQYYKWLSGKRQITIPASKKWTEDGAEKEIQELLQGV